MITVLTWLVWTAKNYALPSLLCWGGLRVVQGPVVFLDRWTFQSSIFLRGFRAAYSREVILSRWAHQLFFWRCDMPPKKQKDRTIPSPPLNQREQLDIYRYPRARGSSESLLDLQRVRYHIIPLTPRLRHLPIDLNQTKQ